MIRKIVKCLGVLLIALVLGVSVIYLVAGKRLRNQLDAAGKIVHTAAGPMQYADTGEEGAVILFLHGTPGGFNHTPFFTTEGLEGYRLLAPSRPGYLATPLDTGRTPAEQARAYAALLDELGIDRVIVWGVSGGGPSALAFAALYPHRTRAVIGLEILSQKIPAPLEVPAVMKSDFASWLLFSLVTTLGDGKAALGMLSPEDVRLIMTSEDGLERVREWLWATWPVSPRLPGWRNDSAQFIALSLPVDRITAPTLLLNGTEDREVSYASAQRLSRVIPGAELYTVQGGNHAMLLSRRQELGTVINAFLNRVLAEETEQ